MPRLFHAALYACLITVTALTVDAATATEITRETTIVERQPATRNQVSPPLSTVEQSATSPNPADSSTKNDDHLFLKRVRGAYEAARNMRHTIMLIEETNKAKRPLTEDMLTHLSSNTRMIMSFEGWNTSRQIPELVSAEARALVVIDRLERTGAYTPPEDINRHLEIWRVKKKLADIIDSGPWVVGPQTVSIDEDALPIVIPKGYRLLLGVDVDQLRQKQAEIRSDAIKRLAPLELDSGEPVSGNNHWVMPIDGSWLGEIYVIKNRHIGLDVAMPQDTNLSLELIRTRLDPFSSLRTSQINSYSRENVRWLIRPEKNTARATIRWAITDGTRGDTLGILFAHMVLGANQQIILQIPHYRVSELVKSADVRLRFTLDEIHPLIESMQFKPEKRVEHSAPDARHTIDSIDALVTGQPTIAELGVKRILEEQKRKQDFWLFLKERPHYLAYLLLFVILVVVQGAGYIFRKRDRDT